MHTSWNRESVNMWTYIVPPSRPSISELNIYVNVIRELQNKLKRKLDILILGSTTEFRDLAYEENMNITVMDYSKEYYDGISLNLKHKSLMKSENLIISKWEDMNFNEGFDVIIGDSSIGNVPKDRLEDFIMRISRALRKKGLFLGKSYFLPSNYQKRSTEEIVKEYIDNYSYLNPFSYMIYDLAVSSLDDNLINFKKIYNNLLELKERKLISNEILNCFKGVKLLSDIKFQYNVPKKEYYEQLIEKYMYIEKILYATEIYSNNFPLYIIRKK